MSSGQQYLRARFYDPASGTFYRLDPFAGNLTDPQSLHKYLYAHGNPVAFSDPSGNFAEPLLLGGQSGGTTSWVRVMTAGVIGAVFARGDAFLRTFYLTGDINAAEDAAADAAAAGFAMGIAVGMLEGGRLTPYIGIAAFGVGLVQAKHEWEAGHHGLAAVDFTLAVFSLFTGVYRPLAAQVRGAGRLPVAAANAAPDIVVPVRPPKTVYHQGDLSGGVSGSRRLSTSPDPDLTHYRPDGTLHRFDIPADVYDRWLLDGSIQPYTDYHLPSGITRPEIRILPPASGQMNDFLVPQSGG